MAVIVRRAAAVDVDGMADALQQAFFDDPVIGFLLPAPTGRRWRTAKLFATALRAHYVPLGTAWTTRDQAGAALWSPPGHWRPRAAEILHVAPTLVRVFGRHLPRAVRAATLADRHHPQEPHWYLAVLGTAPRHQRKGVGSALLAPGLERCDADRLPACLESSSRDNHPFYARHGFEVTAELAIPGGPPIWSMWRAPR
jgi:GNAT superfamily N-acetyltransferase